MKIVNGYLDISAYVDCPHCNESIDLCDIEDLQEEGFIYKKILPNEGLGCKDFGEVICPECKQPFYVNEIVW